MVQVKTQDLRSGRVGFLEDAALKFMRAVDGCGVNLCIDSPFTSYW
jgi:hypothetical protein